MTPRRIATFSLGAAAGVAISAALGAGVQTTGAGVLQRVTVRTRASAGELPAFEDCEQLRRWYVGAALKRVGPYGLDGPPVLSAAPATGPDGALAVRGDAVTSSGTGTNVQEPDVDESDVAKTDGRLVFQMAGGRLVVTDVRGDHVRELSRTTLPGRGLTSAELVLGGDRLVVVGDQGSLPYSPLPADATAPGRLIAPLRAHPQTRIVSVDVSDPSAPRVTRTRSIQGSVVSTRHYADGTVRVVVDDDRPDLDFVMPGKSRTAKQAAAANREVVRSAPVSTWLPAVTSSVPSESGPVDCSDVRHPRAGSGLGTVTVLSLDAHDELDSTSVTAPGDLVYSSATRLYVATSGLRSTSVHVFRLDRGRTSYAGSGTVAGTVKDRWSFSEYDGHLRLLTVLGDPWAPRENAVVVLAEKRGDRRGSRQARPAGGFLVPTGRVGGLGAGEQIKSVRWLGERAVVVTFRQTDPLYTLDLSDPHRPKVEGELEIPGYSAYLHPVGDDLLLGLGHHATSSGSDLGTQAATFDLRDRTDVRRLDTTSFGAGTTLGVESDPRAFSYLPEQRTFLTRVDGDLDRLDQPQARLDRPQATFQAVRVSADGTLTRTGRWRVAWAGAARTLPLGDGRVALVDDDRVRVVRVG